MSNNKFNDIAFRELVDYFEKLKKVKIVIILENMKLEDKVEDNGEIIEFGFVKK